MLYEWRSTVVRKGPPNLQEVQPADAQFRSLYGFPTPTASVIQRQSHMKNLEGRMLYSDMMLIDIDDPDNIPAALKVLDNLGIEYSVWTTGHRGIHIHCPITPMTGVNVVYSQRQWLKSVGLWDLVDTSIYRPAGQFRAPGAIHRKTKQPKQRLRDVPGKLLTIRMLMPPPVVHTDWELEDTDPSKLFDFFMNLLANRGAGGRHMHMYILFKSGRRAGLKRDEVEDCIRWWNGTMTDMPHSELAVEKKLKGFK